MSSYDLWTLIKTRTRLASSARNSGKMPRGDTEGESPERSR